MCITKGKKCTINTINYHYSLQASFLKLTNGKHLKFLVLLYSWSIFRCYAMLSNGFTKDVHILISRTCVCYLIWQSLCQCYVKDLDVRKLYSIIWFAQSAITNILKRKRQNEISHIGVEGNVIRNAEIGVMQHRLKNAGSHQGGESKG